jgi:hypothetical protein
MLLNNNNVKTTPLQNQSGLLNSSRLPPKPPLNTKFIELSDPEKPISIEDEEFTQKVIIDKIKQGAAEDYFVAKIKNIIKTKADEIFGISFNDDTQFDEAYDKAISEIRNEEKLGIESIYKPIIIQALIGAQKKKKNTLSLN